MVVTRKVLSLNTREQRGLSIAAFCRLSRKDDGTWVVPSQTTEGKRYEVDPTQGKCTCLDCTEGGFQCKHFFAVRFTIKRELGLDGTVLETKCFSFMETKKYRQDWRAYNLAQSVEKKRFLVLLHDLCRNI